MWSFNKKQGLISPVSGQCISLKNINDEVFSKLMLGDGIAIEPTSEIVVSPVDGIVEVIMEDTCHAVGLKMKNGIELLIHVGVDTVNLQGKGFKCLVKAGDKVKVGSPLIEFNKKIIEDNGYKATVIFIVTDDKDKEIKFKNETDLVCAGEDMVLDI
ncbi:PTS sugar transporter subunit IIA [Candidatus Epulonipiscioides gigas]|nr:PTS sugar transporter subunit IIA [Epulopiscium sp. SCG-C07WGA-EpuloA2]